MDFQSMKRRELQALCKKNNIPANITNAAMADALSNLPIVEGLEEFLSDPTAADGGSPERSVITSPDVPRTSTRQKVAKEEPEGSKLATRTRIGTRRRAGEGTDAKKTPATRTTRKTASQAATVQKWTEKDMQAAFQADMEQSEVSDNSGLLGELKEMSEDVSGVSVDYEEQLSSECQTVSKNEVHVVFNEVEEVFDVDDLKESLENDDAAKEVQEDPTEMFNGSHKVDFHSLSRRDLQSLCKKNKIPANTTNATMADALESIAIVEGLDEFLKECNSQAPHSPTMSEMTSSCARRTWTSKRINKEPTSSKLITKSCRGSRRRVIEEIDHEKIAASEIPQAGTVVCSMESAQQTDIEYPGDINSDGGRLSVVEGEKDLQCQLEAAERDDPEVQNLVSDTSDGNDLAQEAAVVNKIGESDDYIIGDSLQNVATSEKDNDEGDYDLLNTENVTQLEDSENKKDTDIVDHISTGGSEFAEQLQNMVNEIDENVGGESEDSSVDSEVLSNVRPENRLENIEFENVDEGTNTEGTDIVDHISIGGSEVPEQLQNMLDETEENVRFGGESEDSSENSEVLRDVGSENRSENSEFENVDEEANTEGTDSQIFCAAGSRCEPVEMLEGAQGDQVSKKLESVITSSDFAAQVCLAEQIECNHAEEENTSRNDAALTSHPIEKLEASYTVHETSEDVDAESTNQIDKCGGKGKETPLINTSSNDFALISHPIEKLEASYTLHETSKEVDAESTIQTDQCGAKGKQTPLINKSMRTLKKLLREKLEATSLAKKMEKLTLEVNNDTLANVEEVIDEECEDLEGKSDDGLASSDFDVETADLHPVNKLLDNLTSEDSVTGHINVELDQEMNGEKQFSITPSKMMTPMSFGKMNHVSDDNKENIDHSASKPETVKVSDARSGKLLSDMSIGKLKKALQQHSEKKRPALQARSENCLQLASP